MNALTAIARGIYWTLGALQAVVELPRTVRRLVRHVRTMTLDETQPIPLDKTQAERRRRLREQAARYDDPGRPLPKPPRVPRI